MNIITHFIAAMLGAMTGCVALAILQASAIHEREMIIRHALRLYRENANADNVDQIIDLKRYAEAIGIFIER